MTADGAPRNDATWRPGLGLELVAGHDSPAVQQEAQRGPQGPQTVDDALPEADRRGVREVAAGNRDLDHGQAEVHRLEDDLRVEHEPVRVPEERHRLQEAPAVGPVSRVALGEL